MRAAPTPAKRRSFSLSQNLCGGAALELAGALAVAGGVVGMPAIFRSEVHHASRAHAGKEKIIFLVPEFVRRRGFGTRGCLGGGGRRGWRPRIFLCENCRAAGEESSQE